MKQILIELDDRCARDLERVAPAKKRLRAEFVRNAIRRAIDLALDSSTGRAYLSRPQTREPSAQDMLGWDEQNELAEHASGKARGRRGKSAA